MITVAILMPVFPVAFGIGSMGFILLYALPASTFLISWTWISSPSHQVSNKYCRTQSTPVSFSLSFDPDSFSWSNMLSLKYVYTWYKSMSTYKTRISCRAVCLRIYKQSHLPLWKRSWDKLMVDQIYKVSHWPGSSLFCSTRNKFTGEMYLIKGK